MIEIEGLHKSYRHRGKSVDVLKNLSAGIVEGRFVSVFGLSGAGKSTLLNLAGGLDRDFRGSIRVGGKRLESLSDSGLSSMRGSLIGHVFQAPVFLRHLSVERNLRLAAPFTGVSLDREGALSLLDRFGLKDLWDRLPGELSGGELQRLALARALVGKPKLLLCDEPTGNLDIETGARIIDEFRALNEDGMTLLVATHDLRVAEAGEQVFRLEEGSLIEGSP